MFDFKTVLFFILVPVSLRDVRSLFFELRRLIFHTIVHLMSERDEIVQGEPIQTQDFGAFLWESVPIHSLEHLRGQALMLDEKARLAISIPVHPKVA